MADGGDGVAELAVDAAAVVELLVGVAGRALVLDAADAADSHDEDDEHEDEGHAQRADDDVERVAGHVGQRVVGGVRRLPLQVCRHTHTHTHTSQLHNNNDNKKKKIEKLEVQDLKICNSKIFNELCFRSKVDLAFIFVLQSVGR